ncbi:hypothetical protein C8J46_109105 [Sphingomonas sp. PP-F2F-A104-K0414]|uniref:hypothetical protein n=1 Tax=Sphingomonas sp. PP-F2F-A104-K0414 TaxID=2135661 RepID=UPI00104D1577|nr:hypothetical protein [Sphingomonas sp. PP-F2F-A104-K0414]TCP96409.1 hypothetical protein C8J46_109105 [Sphingomonas sp. PP-F2F-A104-K0414]
MISLLSFCLAPPSKLPVNSLVYAGRIVAVPVEATGPGEMTYVNRTEMAGNRGRLAAKRVHFDLPSGSLPISGTRGTEGEANAAGVVIRVFSFGLLGPLMKGGNARLNAGDILTGITVRKPKRRRHSNDDRPGRARNRCR